jgi:hypothetical protein
MTSIGEFHRVPFGGEADHAKVEPTFHLVVQVGLHRRRDGVLLDERRWGVPSINGDQRIGIRTEEVECGLIIIEVGLNGFHNRGEILGGGWCFEFFGWCVDYRDLVEFEIGVTEGDVGGEYPETGEKVEPIEHVVAIFEFYDLQGVGYLEGTSGRGVDGDLGCRNSPESLDVLVVAQRRDLTVDELKGNLVIGAESKGDEGAVRTRVEQASDLVTKEQSRKNNGLTESLGFGNRRQVAYVRDCVLLGRVEPHLFGELRRLLEVLRVSLGEDH